MARQQTIAPVVAVIALALCAQSAFAQPPVLDTPAISVLNRGFFKIALQVQAGPSGAPAGFAIQWMTESDFEIHGWPSDESSAYLQYCDFTGEATLNIDPDSPTFALPPDGATFVELGDLFDETGIEVTYGDGLPTNTTFAVRVEAEGDDDHIASDFSPTLFVSTTNAECTIGFWKNHSEVWPPGCTPMLLGNVSYTMSELLAIYNTAANGNGLISLAHQLITTKLNECNGSNTSNVAATIAAADAEIENLVIPPIGGGSLSPGSTEEMTQTLDEYNNGHIKGVVNCPTPVLPSTWGGIKALYR